MLTFAHQDEAHVAPGEGAASSSKAPAGDGCPPRVATRQAGRKAVNAVASDAAFEGAVLLALGIVGILVGAQRLLPR